MSMQESERLSLCVCECAYVKRSELVSESDANIMLNAKKNIQKDS